MNIRFLESVEVKNGAGDVTESYGAGEVHDLRPDKARHWLKREKAVEEGAAPPPARPTPEPVEQTDAFEKYRQAAGVAPGSGPEAPSSASGVEKASDATMSSGSGDGGTAAPTGSTEVPTATTEVPTGSTAAPDAASEPKADAGSDGSSSSTGDGKSPDGPTSSTPATPPGGGQTRKRRRSQD